MGASRDLFKPDEVAAIEEAIIAAELKTSGEIRVYIESHPGEGVGVLDRATVVFQQLELHKTSQRNGVLIYLAVDARQFAILGDQGIHQMVPEDFWDTIKEDMQTHFRDGRFAEGMAKGIGMAGDALIRYFPYDREDKNELPDEVVFG